MSKLLTAFLAFATATALFADEAALLRQLAATDPVERDAARQALLTTATVSAIPALSAQLASPDTFDNACFLLESMKQPTADAGGYCDANDADALIALLGQPDTALADAARMSLIKFADAKVDSRIVRALGKRALSPEAAVRLLGVATFRKSPKAAQKVTPYLADASPAVRTAAFTALIELAEEKQLGDLFAAVCKASDAAEKRAAEKALFATSRRLSARAASEIRPLFAARPMSARAPRSAATPPRSSHGPRKKPFSQKPGRRFRPKRRRTR